MARRHKLDIIAEILKLAQGGSKKTRLVYQANINFTMLVKYTALLEKKSFIHMMNDHIYTTHEGLEFLRQYEQMRLAWDFSEEAEKARAEEARANL
jgi:predicted transcriptional regulator